MKSKLIFTILFFTTIVVAQTKSVDPKVKNSLEKVENDSTRMEQLIKDIGNYELFDSAKDIDSNVKELRNLQQKRLNELLQADVLYNRYDATITTLLQMGKIYENKKILQPKEPDKKSK